MRKELHLDDLKDAGEWVWDKLNSKPQKAPEPIPIVVDIPMQEEETTMRSSSVAHEDPPPPEEPRARQVALGATSRDGSRRSDLARSG